MNTFGDTTTTEITDTTGDQTLILNHQQRMDYFGDVPVRNTKKRRSELIKDFMKNLFKF